MNDHYGKHEALDRCHVLASMLDDHLLSHLFVQSNMHILAELKRASDAIASAYQMIGEAGVADEEGWIAWDGGEMPVPYWTMVDVKYREKGVSLGVRAGVWRGGGSAYHWGRNHVNSPWWDIVAYRVVPYRFNPSPFNTP